MSQWLYDALVERMNSLEGNRVLTDLNSLIHSQGSQPMATAAVVAFYVLLPVAPSRQPSAISRQQKNLSGRAA